MLIETEGRERDYFVFRLTARHVWTRAALQIWRGVVLTGAAAVLFGCAHSGDMTPQSAARVGPVDALIYPPIGGPGILGVVETVFPNAIKQDIALATNAGTAGQNKISLILFKGKSGDGSDSALIDVPFTEVNLTEEALAAFPNTGMGVSPYFVQNTYGPFGYAVGKPGNGDTCIYAWQRLAPALKPSGAVARGTVVIRLQLCDRNRNEESLLGVMYQLRVNDSLFPPGRARTSIGRIGAPILPTGADGFVEVVKSAPPAPTRAATPRVVAAPVAPVVIQPPIGAPIVPLPSGLAPSGSIVPSPLGGGSANPIVPSPGITPVSTPLVLVPPPPRVTQ